MTDKVLELLEDENRAAAERARALDQLRRETPGAAGYDAAGEAAAEICDRWVAKFGLGFNPDTRGAEYVQTGCPEWHLSKAEVAEYERDMEALCALPIDPHEACLDAMKRAGLDVE